MYQDRIIRNGLPVISVASRHTNIVLLISGHRYRSPNHAIECSGNHCGTGRTRTHWGTRCILYRVVWPCVCLSRRSSQMCICRVKVSYKIIWPNSVSVEHILSEDRLNFARRTRIKHMRVCGPIIVLTFETVANLAWPFAQSINMDKLSIWTKYVWVDYT